MNRRDKFILIFIGLLIVVILLILFSQKEKEFDIQDRCGPIVNMISHTIPSDASCKIRCKQKCDTVEMSYSKHIFVEVDAGCHTCTCYCKEGFLK